MKRPILRPILLTLLVGTAVGAVWSPQALAQDCPQNLVVADGEDSLSCTLKDYYEKYVKVYGEGDNLYSNGALLDGANFLVSGSGPIEVIVTLEDTSDNDAPFRFELSIAHSGSEGWAGDPLHVQDSGRFFRELLQDPSEHLLHIDLFVTWKPGFSGEIPAGGIGLYLLHHDVDVKVIVRRIPMQCSMWARVSGDVNDTFYGDVAYYLHSTSGVMVDPEAMAALGQLLGLTNQGDQAADDFASAMAKEMPGNADQNDEEDGGGKKGESIGLVLQDFKIDQELPYQPESGAKQAEASLEVAAMIARQFGLGLRAALIATPEGKPALRINGGSATVGAVVAGAGDRIRFEFIKGQSEGELTMLQYPGTDMAYGTFTGDLYTRHKYSLGGGPEHQLHVHIEANFTAMKGQFTCVKVRQ